MPIGDLLLGRMEALWRAAAAAGGACGDDAVAEALGLACYARAAGVRLPYVLVGTRRAPAAHRGPAWRGHAAAAAAASAGEVEEGLRLVATAQAYVGGLYGGDVEELGGGLLRWVQDRCR